LDIAYYNLEFTFLWPQGINGSGWDRVEERERGREAVGQV